MKSQLQVATHFHRKIIANTIPLMGPFSGSYWFIQYKSKKFNFPLQPTVKRLCLLTVGAELVR